MGISNAKQFDNYRNYCHSTKHGTWMVTSFTKLFVHLFRQFDLINYRFIFLVTKNCSYMPVKRNENRKIGFSSFFSSFFIAQY